MIPPTWLHNKIRPNISYPLSLLIQIKLSPVTFPVLVLKDVDKEKNSSARQLPKVNNNFLTLILFVIHDLFTSLCFPLFFFLFFFFFFLIYVHLFYMMLGAASTVCVTACRCILS
ncbi:hypothetical protein VNO78_06068 [Psophocarpus tetragonolobus]|uniref:Uncharacterized protein n=1 Tax=Psophocarpus tetragonolobus TaxID=3891 RepID=A0AAN9T0T9_PSOTE